MIVRGMSGAHDRLGPPTQMSTKEEEIEKEINSKPKTSCYYAMNNLSTFGPHMIASPVQRMDSSLQIDKGL